MLTLARQATSELQVRRSRFTAHAGRVDSLAEMRAFYEAVADPDATHNCWAWRLGHQHRLSDNGEPPGTAGKPILAALEGRDLDHAMVVVTRYFGGVKLGVGGLIRAYGTCAALCLERAGSRKIVPKVTCSIRASFQWTGAVYAALLSARARKLKELYGPDGLTVEAELAADDFPDFARLLSNTTRGEVRPRPRTDRPPPAT